MRDAIPLGRIAGFVVNVHWSVLVILWLFTWSLATMLPGTVGGYPAVVYWLLGAGGAVMLLASLLAHELAHAVVARRAGVSVESVTLWLFGGVTALGGEAKTPKAAFRIAFAGPATSLALSATFGALAITLAGVRTPAIVISVAWWLATVNLLLGLFNLLPGAPLDGGRLVRAYLWRRHGDSARRDRCGAGRTGGCAGLDRVGIGRVCGWWPRRWGLVSLHWLVYLRCRSRGGDPDFDPAAVCRGACGRCDDRPTAYGSRMDQCRGFHPALRAW